MTADASVDPLKFQFTFCQLHRREMFDQDVIVRISLKPNIAC